MVGLFTNKYKKDNDKHIFKTASKCNNNKPKNKGFTEQFTNKPNKTNKTIEHFIKKANVQ